LISVPVATVFGIDRDDLILVDLPNGGLPNAIDVSDIRAQPLAKQAVASVCAVCNNGWMNDLEHRVSTVFAGWLRGEKLDAVSKAVISAWMLGRLIVWMYRDAGHRQLLENAAKGRAVILANPTQGLNLATGRWEAALESVVVGAALSSDAAMFGFGHATTQPHQLRALTGVLALQLSSLQLWAVNVAITGAAISLPTGVRLLSAGLRRNDLSRRPASASSMDPQSVVVRFT